MRSSNITSYTVLLGALVGVGVVVVAWNIVLSTMLGVAFLEVDSNENAIDAVEAAVGAVGVAVDAVEAAVDALASGQNGTGAPSLCPGSVQGDPLVANGTCLGTVPQRTIKDEVCGNETLLDGQMFVYNDTSECLNPAYVPQPLPLCIVRPFQNGDLLIYNGNCFTHHVPLIKYCQNGFLSEGDVLVYNQTGACFARARPQSLGVVYHKDATTAYALTLPGQTTFSTLALAPLSPGIYTIVMHATATGGGAGGGEAELQFQVGDVGSELMYISRVDAPSGSRSAVTLFAAMNITMPAPIEIRGRLSAGTALTLSDAQYTITHL